MSAQKNDTLLCISYDLAYALVEYEDFIKRINNFNENERKYKLEKCDEFTNKISELKRSYILELKNASEADKEYWLPQLKKRMEHYKYLQEQVEKKKHEINQENLIAQVEEETTNEAQVQAMMKRGDEVQDKTQGALTNMKNMVLETEEIGIATAAKMDAQIEQMENIGNKIERINKNVDIAKKKARQIKYACLKDKCLVMLVVTNILVLAIIICIYIFWQQHEDPAPAHASTTTEVPATDTKSNVSYSVPMGSYKDNPSSVVPMADGVVMIADCTGIEVEDYAFYTRYRIRGIPYGYVDFSYMTECESKPDIVMSDIFNGYPLFMLHIQDVSLS